MDNFYLGIVAGVFAPIVLALVAKAIKRIPTDTKALFTAVAHYIKG